MYSFLKAFLVLMKVPNFKILKFTTIFKCLIQYCSNCTSEFPKEFIFQPSLLISVLIALT